MNESEATKANAKGEALAQFLTLCRERYKRAKDASDTTRRLFPDGEMGPLEKAITDSYAAQPALVEMVEKFQEYLSTDFCICDSDQEYKCDFCELNAAIDLLAEQALREMGEG